MDYIKEENGLQDKNEIKKSPNKREIDSKKKMMTLNLNSSSPQKKKLTANNNVPLLGSQTLRSPMMQVILESPDVRKFGLQTPEYIEKFLSTPSLANKHFIKQINDLNEVINNQNNASNSDSSRPPSNASSSNYNFNNSEQFIMQDDNSNATSLISGGNSNCSFNTSNNSANNQSFNENSEHPMNLKNQDLTKLERKRLRNRIAASKCRKRKLERISNLEEKVQKLKNDNYSLTQEVTRLKDRNEKLRREVLTHREHGCSIEF